jgi:endonuclease/exonuclease/phosphatase family metal-dependent hydrolase
MGEIAQVIADEDVDVVTMQEMFGQDADDLERELRERTGDEWTVYFGEASEKPYWSDGFRPRGFNEPFGNAIAVRHGGNVETSEYVDTHKLDVPGSHVEPPTIPSPQTPPGPDDPPPSAGVTDGEGRSAIEVELTLGGGG